MDETDLQPAGIYLLKVNNRNTGTRCEICSKLTIKTPERRHWRFKPCCSASVVNFEHVIAGWADTNSLAHFDSDKYWPYQNYSLSVIRFSYQSPVVCWLNKLQVIHKH